MRIIIRKTYYRVVVVRDDGVFGPANGNGMTARLCDSLEEAEADFVNNWSYMFTKGTKLGIEKLETSSSFACDPKPIEDMRKSYGIQR